MKGRISSDGAQGLEAGVLLLSYFSRYFHAVSFSVSILLFPSLAIPFHLLPIFCEIIVFEFLFLSF